MTYLKKSVMSSFWNLRYIGGERHYTGVCAGNGVATLLLHTAQRVFCAPIMNAKTEAGVKKERRN